MNFPRFTRFQLLAHAGSLVPLAWLIVDFFRDNLTVNPIQALTLRTGKYALVLLILSLSCTPVNTLFGFSPALKVRRALGLYAFLYASLHFLIFVGLDYGFDPGLLREAIFEKPFALVGLSAFLILLALALTSTRGWMKRLGKRWTRLHRFVYLAGILVIVHYSWAVKSDIRVPLLYGVAILSLLIARVPAVRRSISAFRHSNIRGRINNIWERIWGRKREKLSPLSDPTEKTA